MEKADRRKFLGGAALTAAGLTTSSLGQPNSDSYNKNIKQDVLTVSGTNKTNVFKSSFVNDGTSTASWGSASEIQCGHIDNNFAMSSTKLIVYPERIREEHWHSSASEWAYVVSGKCRMTISGPEDYYNSNVFSSGNIWFVPRGYVHSIEAIGSSNVEIITVHDRSLITEKDAPSISAWQSFDSELSTFEDVTQAIDLAQSPLNNSLTKDCKNKDRNHYFNLSENDEICRRFDAGITRMATSKEFPISQATSGALTIINIDGKYKPHWHPSSNEWLYVLDGGAEISIFKSATSHAVEKFNVGDIACIPAGVGHTIKNIGAVKLKLLHVFDSGYYQEMSITTRPNIDGNLSFNT